MKPFFLFCSLSTVLLLHYKCARAQANNEGIIKLAFTLQDGYANEQATTMSNFINWVDKDDPTISAQQFKGLPTFWKNIKFATLIFDEPQYYYQLFSTQKIDSITYRQKTEKFDALQLRPLPVKAQLNCYVFIVAGINPAGEAEIIIDANNNKDFSDDELLNFNTQPEYQKNGFLKTIKLQLATSTGIKEQNLPIKLFYSGKANDFQQTAFHFPVYGLTYLTSNGTRYEIRFNSTYALSLNFIRTQFFIKNLGKENSSPIEQEKFIRIGNEVFENIAVDIHHHLLYLKKLTGNDIISPMAGFNAPDFSTKEVTTNNTISLAKYKGKYLIMDFWATWCPPCIQSMVQLKEKQAVLAKYNIAVLGVNIAAKEEITTARNTIQKNNFIGDQLYSAEVTNLYKVGAIPANFLISPEGKIIATDIDFSNLEAELKKYLSKVPDR